MKILIAMIIMPVLLIVVTVILDANILELFVNGSLVNMKVVIPPMDVNGLIGSVMIMMLVPLIAVIQK
jgi:hypothetical protein